MKNLPVYKLKIPEDDAFVTELIISLVDAPAIKLGWQKFAEQKRSYFSADEDRQLIMGALLVADMPIYRRIDDQEFYVVFEKEDIFKIVDNFFKVNAINNFNIMHENGRKFKNMHIVESMIIDASRGINAPDAFKGISEGSWIVTAKIDDPVFWAEYIKTGKLTGFSMEGLFSYEKIAKEDEGVLEEVAQIVIGNA